MRKYKLVWKDIGTFDENWQYELEESGTGEYIKISDLLPVVKDILEKEYYDVDHLKALSELKSIFQ